MERKEVAFIEPTLRGRERFTVERFFSGCGDHVATSMALAALRSGFQIEVAAVTWQLVPALVILCAWSLHYNDVDLIDDYDALLELHREAIVGPDVLAAHPDMYLASCIALLAKREEFPGREAFEQVNVPSLYREILQQEI